MRAHNARRSSNLATDVARHLAATGQARAEPGRRLDGVDDGGHEGGRRWRLPFDDAAEEPVGKLKMGMARTGAPVKLFSNPRNAPALSVGRDSVIGDELALGIAVSSISGPCAQLETSIRPRAADDGLMIAPARTSFGHNSGPDPRGRPIGRA